MEFIAINPHKLKWKIEAIQRSDGLLEIRQDIGKYHWRNTSSSTMFHLNIPNFIFHATFNIPLPWKMKNIHTEQEFDVHHTTLQLVLRALSDPKGCMEVISHPSETLVQGYWTFLRSNRYYFPIPYGSEPDTELLLKAEADKILLGIR